MNPRAEDLLSVARDGSVAVLTLRYGPGHETLSHASAQALLQALHESNTDSSCHGIVLAGGADFCPGGDFSSGAPSRDDLIALRGCLQAATTLYRDLRRGPKPVLAAVEGKACGAGLALVAACDYVVAATDASFFWNALAEGRLPDGGLLWSLPERIGDAKAREFVLLGRAMAADEAHQAGLVGETVAPGTALAQALRVARQFEALPMVTVALIKAALFNGAVSMADGIRMELDLNPLGRQAVDHLEAVAAFMEKRKPDFIGN